MVALGDDGKPSKIPPLTITNATQQRRYDEALKRREARLQLQASLKKK
jgi:acyl-CoA hydrolase